MPTITQKMIDDVGRELMNRGLIIAAGWEGYKLLKAPIALSERQREAFFAGAQHLFASIMNSGLDESTPDATDADLKRIDNIARELKEFECTLEKTMH